MTEDKEIIAIFEILDNPILLGICEVDKTKLINLYNCIYMPKESLYMIVKLKLNEENPIFSDLISENTLEKEKYIFKGYSTYIDNIILDEDFDINKTYIEEDEEED